MNLTAILVLIALSNFVGGLAVGIAFSRRSRRRGAQPIESRWIDLPSGFSCEYGPGFVGYVSPTDDGAYWWLARRGRTIIEGPASTVGLGKVQVEQAAAEFKF